MRIRGLVLAVGLAAALAGCTAIVPASPPPADPAEVWSKLHAAFLAEHGDFPEGDPEYSEDEAHAALAEKADEAWANTVLVDYPDAIRPSEGFERWVTEDDYGSLESDLATCYSDHGIGVSLGYLADGTVGGMEYLSDGTEAAQVGRYFCQWVAYPSRPSPPPNEARLGYMWDYYNEFLVPCFDDFGVPQSPIIPRDEWIDSFPRANWSLKYPQDDTDLDLLIETCPQDLLH
jgi:hypothetical protein